MRGGTESQGYTILEVMIFMAISGLMFVIAAGFVNGKQAKTQFRQSMNSIAADVQRVIDDVDNGFYPSGQDFNCKAVAGNLNISAGSSKQGENLDCVFMGKVIQFGVTGGNEGAYNVYSIAGLHYVPSSGNRIPTSFIEAKPKVIGFNTTEHNIFSGSEKVTKVTSSGAPINGIGFFSSFGTYASGVSLQSGSQNVIVVKIPGPGVLGESETSMVTDIESQVTNPANQISNPNIGICVDSGSGQFGKLTIGGTSNQRLTTSVKIGNNADAAAVGC